MDVVCPASVRTAPIVLVPRVCFTRSLGLSLLGTEPIIFVLIRVFKFLLFVLLTFYYLVASLLPRSQAVHTSPDPGP